MDLIYLYRLGEELIYLYVESEQQDSNDVELVPSIEKYVQHTSNQFNLLFDNDLDRHSITEIEESSIIDASKSNIEQTSSYLVEFPQNDRSNDESKFSHKKRFTKNDSSGNTLYSCEICDISFSDKTEYHKHELIHYVDYPYECNLCGNHFKRFKQLENHKMYHHNVKDLSEENNSNTNLHESDKIDRCCGTEMKKLTYKISGGKGSRCNVVKSLPTKDSSETCKKYYESNKLFVNETDQKVFPCKRPNNEDIYMCETCGQKFSASSMHKCSKPKTTSV